VARHLLKEGVVLKNVTVNYKRDGMNRVLLFFILLVVPFSKSPAQEKGFDEQAFFANMQTSYYSLAGTGIQNFVALVSSSKMQTFARQAWKNKDVFPLQLIWFNPNKIYLSQQGVPSIPKGKYKEYQDLLKGLKMQVKGLLVDLQRFYFQGLYNSISGDYILKHNDKEVQITQIQHIGNVTTKLKYLFGLNGLLLYNEISYPSQNKVITVYPKFRTVKNQWLCDGWSVQTFINGEVESGFDLKLTSQLVNNVYVPVDISLEVQKAEKKGQTFVDKVILRNYLFNQSIRFVNPAGN